MALKIPTRLEDNFALPDGSKGNSLIEAFSFKRDNVNNVFSYDSSSRQYKLSFQEHGVAYGESNASDMLVELSTEVSGSADFNLVFSPGDVTMWGLTYAGVVRVRHFGSPTERVIYVPGTRTYDPAGKSGDPHASERIGPSCSRTQAAISLAQLMAALKGADIEILAGFQDKLRPLITRYHGRECLFDWMLLQVKQAIFENRDVTPYPEYLKEQILKGRLVISQSRQHTRLYLESYNKGNPRPPTQYYRKVAAKDKISDLLNKEEMEQFGSLVEEPIQHS